MDIRSSSAHTLVIVGGIAMLLGALDPLKGAAILLTGTALVLLGTVLGQAGPRLVSYWILVFVLVGVGVTAMVVLNVLGDFGATGDRSLWWGILILPYPIGWIMGMLNLLLRVAETLHHRVIA